MTVLLRITNIWNGGPYSKPNKKEEFQGRENGCVPLLNIRWSTVSCVKSTHWLFCYKMQQLHAASREESSSFKKYKERAGVQKYLCYI